MSNECSNGDVRWDGQGVGVDDGALPGLQRIGFVRTVRTPQFDGITFGLPEVDQHTLGIHPGELCVIAATSGGGKSWFAGLIVLEEFRRGRRCILFTLENDVLVHNFPILAYSSHFDFASSSETFFAIMNSEWTFCFAVVQRFEPEVIV